MALSLAACGSDGDGDFGDDLSSDSSGASGGSTPDPEDAYVPDPADDGPDAGSDTSPSDDESDAGDEAAVDAEDAGANDGEEDAGASGDAEPEGPDLSGAFVELPGSFALEEPSTLSDLFALLLSDTGDVRLFVTQLQPADDRYDIEYGAADEADGVLSWQKPDTLRTFSVAPVPGEPLTYASQPFDFELQADLMAFGIPFEVMLTTVDAQWRGTFSQDGESLESGTVSGYFPRARAEEVSFGFPLCSFACPGGCQEGADDASTMAGVLDCNNHQPDADLDGDGTLDAYSLRIAYSGERAELAP